jgi:hypothetical protein
VTQAKADRTPPSRTAALLRLAGLYVAVQVVSYFVLQTSCSPYVLGDLWIHGALGPLAAVEAVPRFRYHSLLSNCGFVLLCVAVLTAPFAHVIWPRRGTMIVSLIGLVVWWLFGLGFTINHM